MRLRFTALPIFLVTVKPKRGSGPAGWPSGRRRICSMNVPVDRRLALLAARKSPRFLMVSKDKWLSAEALATFGAAGVDDPAATDGSHAGAETVTARADELTGLKGPFHGEYPEVMRLRRAIYKEVGGSCQREKRVFWL